MIRRIDEVFQELYNEMKERFEYLYDYLLKHPEEVGLTADDFAGKSDRYKREMVMGECFAKVSGYTGMVASTYLIKAQWGQRTSDGKKVSPDWFDHRYHLLYPGKWFTGSWAMHADNVMSVLPSQGTLLDLCSGDGFYDRYFYAKHAKEIVCVEINTETYRHATRLHKAANITYLLQDVLTYHPRESYYDVVVIQNAIEHFTQEEQQIIFKKSREALKPGGWFCGDTPAFPKQQTPVVPAHKNEWSGMAEMRQELGKVFENIETFAVGKALFWKCNVENRR